MQEEVYYLDRWVKDANFYREAWRIVDICATYIDIVEDEDFTIEDVLAFISWWEKERVDWDAGLREARYCEIRSLYISFMHKYLTDYELDDILNAEIEENYELDDILDAEIEEIEYQISCRQYSDDEKPLYKVYLYMAVLCFYLKEDYHATINCIELLLTLDVFYSEEYFLEAGIKLFSDELFEAQCLLLYGKCYFCAERLHDARWFFMQSMLIHREYYEELK